MISISDHPNGWCTRTLSSPSTTVTTRPKVSRVQYTVVAERQLNRFLRFGDVGNVTLTMSHTTSSLEQVQGFKVLLPDF